MALTLPPDTTRRLQASIKKFLSEQLDEDVGDLRATLFLDFCLQEIGPTIYNRAIADAQGYFTGRVQDLEGVCHEPEFAYWVQGRSGARDRGRSGDPLEHRSVPASKQGRSGARDRGRSGDPWNTEGVPASKQGRSGARDRGR